MERKNLTLTNKKRVPNENRFPRRRPPLKVRKSFAADQKKYDDADDLPGVLLEEQDCVQLAKFYSYHPYILR